MNTQTITILVVDADERSRDRVREYLEHAGFTVLTVADGVTALASARQHVPDIILVDLVLPGMDGLELCRRLRSFTDAYIILCSQETAEIERVVGLEIGADDYLTKPFGLRELLARVRAMLRRPRRKNTYVQLNQTFIECRDNLLIDLEERRVTVAGARVSLTGRQFKLLATLASQPGYIWSRAELLERVWNLRSSKSRRVDVAIAELRKKLGDNSAYPRYIESVSGLGYRFVGVLE
jgi:two-component system, OmpR family, alkaline phosphatase synthesis response regulator PhoP